ncbi:hypothetical protein [Pseudobacter ginsenosidimutans]|uniref:Uncharacterized protein n=1 Tax=Pseudobacter ginsenosidimutans TaxID=661488 RepID=A0A4V2F221_9BACT|nr:hypothetical protein [Pseudobacter ginsenosidimutans]QEC44296.1 hypothetical protein FSB84_22425 [Pseudobacter ginsenosidimutans]RZS75757.1 hypothetical protein EV199_1630 [Pseudobacter ginsenosidimutans]
MKEYKLSKGWVITTFFIATLFIVLFAWLCIYLQQQAMIEKQMPVLTWIIPLGCLFLVLLMIYAMWDAIKGRFVITGNSVFTEYPFSRRELLFSEIKGYRVDDQYIHILPTTREKKKLRISKYYGRSQEIIAWLNTRYDDVDARESYNEYREMMDNEEYGRTEIDRAEKLEKAKKTASFLNFTGAIAGGWIFFWPQPYKLAATVAILFPLMAALIMRKYSGLLRLDVKDKAAYGKLNFAFLGPAFGLALAALYEFNILNYDKIWLPAIVLTIILGGLVFSGRNLMPTKKNGGAFVFFLMMLFYFGYGFGAITVINCGFDDSAPETKKVTVTDSRSSKGKSYSYYISVRNGNATDGPLELKVPREIYSTVQKGDEVLLDFRKGLLEAPWVNVRTSDGSVSAVHSHR